MYPCPGKIMVLLHSSESLGLRMWPAEFMKSCANKYIKMWSSWGCFSYLLFPLLLCYLFSSVVQLWLFPLGTGAETWGLAAGSPQSGRAGPIRCAQRASASSHSSSGESKHRKAQVSLCSERCCTCCGWALHHPAALLWWSFLRFLWRSLLTMDCFPPEKWKQFCCSSSPLEVFNGRCVAAALESLRSPLLSHHRVRERHVDLKSLLRDSWTWTWLLLCRLWIKAKSQSPLTRLVLQ